MSRGSELSAAIEVALGAINPGNGFATDMKEIYGFGSTKPDKAPAPYILLRIAEDTIEGFVGTKAKRGVTYEVQGVMSRAATLQELQLFHHDILKALGQGQLPETRPVKAGWPFEETAEFDPSQDGGAQRSVISTVTFAYVETY